jgi:hypothetical protein
MPLPFRNLSRAIGSPDDTAATDSTSSWSWVSLLKGIYQKISDGTLAQQISDDRIHIAEASTSARGMAHAARARASAYATTQALSLIQGAVAHCTDMMRRTKVLKSDAQTAADAAADAANRAAGLAQSAQRQRLQGDVLANQVFS